MISESMILSKENGYYNMDKLKRLPGKNILYITGLSGSGKSTLARELEQEYKPAIYIELDWFEFNRYVFSSMMKSPGAKIVRDYIQANYGDNRNFEEDSKTEFYEKFNKFVLYLQEYAYNHPDTIFILEGVQIIYWFVKYEEFYSSPLIIVNTSVLQSQIRQIKRAAGDKSELLWMFKNFFSRLNQNIDRDKELDELRKLKEENNMSDNSEFFKLMPSIIQEGRGNMNDKEYLLAKQTVCRQFLTEVRELARNYKLSFFCVTEAASAYSDDKNCEAVKHARDCHIEWEKEHGYDPYEDWSNKQ